MIAKFDPITRREWRSHIKDKEQITVASLTEFLEKRCLIIKLETSKSVSRKLQSNKLVHQQKNSTVFTSKENRSMRKCIFCDEDSHLMYSCNRFKDLTVSQRLNAVNERKLCCNCLRPNHFAQNCQSSNCKKCNAKHNTLLHQSDQIENTISLATTKINSGDSENIEQHNLSVNCSSINSPVQSRVLLSTARVWIYNASGNTHECRVLLDSASQSNFLTKEFCSRLQLTTHNHNCSVGG